MSAAALLGGVSHAAMGHVLSNSVYGDGSTGYFSKTWGAAPTDAKKVTIVVDLKRTTFGAASNYDSIIAADGAQDAWVAFKASTSADVLYIEDNNLEATRTTNVFRDTAHGQLMLVYDTTQASANDRLKIYWEGQQITGLTISNITQNDPVGFTDNGTTVYIGRGLTAANYFTQYFSRFILIDGQALTPSSFGETDATTGSWKPKRYAGTYGTNGFHLDFADVADLGNDVSGNNNNFTKSGTVTQTTDSPTDQAANNVGNYCTWNPLHPSSSTLSNGNHTAAGTAIGTISVSQSDKWYWEITANAVGVSAGLINEAGTTYTQGVPNGTTTGFRYTHSTTTLEYTTDGSAWNTVSAAVAGIVFPYSTGASATLKNGNSAVALSYTIPTGFKRLCTANLPAPTIKKLEDLFNAEYLNGNNIESTIATDRTGWSGYVDLYKNRTSGSTQTKIRFSHDDTNEYVSGSASGGASATCTHQAKVSISGTDMFMGATIRIGSAYGTAAGSVSHTNGVATTVTHNLANSNCMIFLFQRGSSKAAPVYHPGMTAGSLTDFSGSIAEAASTAITNIGANSFDIGSGQPTATYDYLVITDSSGLIKLPKWTGASGGDNFIYAGIVVEAGLFRQLNGAGWFWFDWDRQPYNLTDDELGLEYTGAENSWNANATLDFLSNGVKVRGAATNYLADSGQKGVGLLFGRPLGGQNTTQGKAR